MMKEVPGEVRVLKKNFEYIKTKMTQAAPMFMAKLHKSRAAEKKLGFAPNHEEQIRDLDQKVRKARDLVRKLYSS